MRVALAGLRRLALLFGGVAVAIGSLSVLVGLALGSELERAASVGFYLVGAFALVLGVFAGSRGPLRARGSGEREPFAGMFGIGIAARGARRATADERQDATATAGILLGLGLWLILLGVAADTSVGVF